MGTPDGPVTVVITRAVREGCEEAFEAAVRAWAPRIRDFPGHLGVLMLRPPPGGREYGAILKFRSRQDWVVFQDWPEYRQFLEDIRTLLDADPRVDAVPGLETWLAPLGARMTRVPPRWKMAVVTWVGVCLVVYGVSLLLSPFALVWPWLAGFLVGNGLVVAGLTWVVMPVLGRLFRWWLHPDGPAS